MHERIKQVDSKLFELVQGINILDAVAPENYKEARSQFFESNFSKNPEFVYAKAQIPSFERKRALFNIPVDALPDDDLIELYQDIIQSYVDKIDQFNSVGTPDFVYDCLQYYGEPNQKDIDNAKFLLHLPGELNELSEDLLSANEVIKVLDKFAAQHGYQYQLLIDDNMIASALVSGTTIKVNSQAQIPSTEANALAHHEVGVHLVTTLNARVQPIRALTLGSPLNTMTQEGLAILCEYLAGYLSIPRLKVLAFRVLAVNSMLMEKDFKSTFLLLTEHYGVSQNLAFTITARVYRGGGFTKDYLYLRGLHTMLNAYETESDFTNLLAGKVSLDHLPLITRLIQKGYLNAPEHISPAIQNPVINDPIKAFIAHAIK